MSRVMTWWDYGNILFNDCETASPAFANAYNAFFEGWKIPDIMIRAFRN